jgi:hypothetical protein
MRTVITVNGIKVTFHEKMLEGYRFNMHESKTGCLRLRGGIEIPVGGAELSRIIRL